MSVPESSQKRWLGDKNVIIADFRLNHQKLITIKQKIIRAICIYTFARIGEDVSKTKQQLIKSQKDAQSIHKAIVEYKEKTLTLNIKSIDEHFFKVDKTFSEITKIVTSFFHPLGLFQTSSENCIPAEVAQHIVDYLGDLKDIMAVARVNRQGYALAKLPLYNYAKRIGYTIADSISPTGEPVSPFAFLSSIYQILKDQTVIPKKHLIFTSEKTTIDLPATLENLKSLSSKDIFEIFSNEKAFYPFFVKVKNWIISHQKEMKQKENDPSISQTTKVLALRNCLRALDADLLKVLLLHGVDPNIGFRRYYNYANEIAITPLSYVCFFEDPLPSGKRREVVKVLLESGADPNIGDNLESTPLHHAAQAGSLDIVQLLLEHGAMVNLRAQGSTALAFACGYGTIFYFRPNIKVLRLLLQKGADPTIPTEAGKTPLQLAEENELSPDFIASIIAALKKKTEAAHS